MNQAFVREQAQRVVENEEAKLMKMIQDQLCGPMGRFVGAGEMTIVYVRCGMHDLLAGLAREDMVESERFHKRVCP